MVSFSEVGFWWFAVEHGGEALYDVGFEGSLGYPRSILCEWSVW